jgi:hypothetical protein
LNECLLFVSDKNNIDEMRNRRIRERRKKERRERKKRIKNKEKGLKKNSGMK